MLLFSFGSGPVKGFAVTMILGICISMFTAVTVVRVIMTALVRRRHLKTLEIEPLFRLAAGDTGGDLGGAFGRRRQREIGRIDARHVDMQVDAVEQRAGERSEEHTSELQSLMRISY